MFYTNSCIRRVVSLIHPLFQFSLQKSMAMAMKADRVDEDFGQKLDLTVRIREILRDYPHGNSILKVHASLNFALKMKVGITST